jgi:8-oxo-dGTP pyrophosphatase MutT (NUDIX family)
MIKGIDYTGVTVSFYCHDGKGNYVMHKRGVNCRDEQGRWDFGGGGLKFNEKLLDAVSREVNEEYGTFPLAIESIGNGEVFRIHEGKPTHWIAFRYRVLLDRERVINNEPHKHDELMWVTLDNLPSPLHSQLPTEIEKYKDVLL